MSKTISVTDFETGLSAEDLQDVFDQLDAFRHPAKTQEEIEKEREEELREWELDYEEWRLRQHELEEGYEYD